MSSNTSPAKPAKAASSSNGPQSSYQDRLRYAIDLLRQSEIEKSDLISKLSAAATPLPQRVKTVRRVVIRPTQNGETEEVEEEEEVEVDREEQEEEEEEEQKVEAVEPQNGRSQKEEQEQERRAREREKQEAQERERERERTARDQAAEARKPVSKPASKASTPRGSLTSPPRKSNPVTPQKDETKTTPRRTASTSSTSAVSTASPTRATRSTASSATVARAPFSTPPSNRTVSRTKGSPLSASSNTSSPATVTRRSGGSGGRAAKEAAAPTDDSPAVPLTQRTRSTSSTSSSSSAVADDSSILQTYIRFLLSPARLLAYRGALPATPTRYETIEWLRVDEDADDEMQSIHSVSLKGHEHDDELAVMINSKQLHDADMQRELCIQLWSHSNDVDAVDLSSDAAPEHDLLVQFTATVPELAQCANPDSNGEWQGKDEEEDERYAQIADFFVSVEVMLHEEGDRREKDKRLELEIAIEQERMRLMQEGRSPSPIPPTTSSTSTAAQRTPVKVRVSTGPSGTSTPQRRPSLTSLTAPILATALPSMLDDFHDLIMPDRVFARRQRQKAEDKRRQKRAAAAAAAGDGSNTTSPTARSPNNSHTPSPHHSPSSSQSSSPALASRSIVPFTPFEPTYYRVKMTVRDLPKMNFHGSCDSYFHILLSSTRDSSPPSSSLSAAVPPGAAVTSAALQSLYRSEVQFNQLNPRFASFVISSVRDRDRDRLITLRMINWRQRVEAGHEEVIGEVTLPLAALIPAGGGGGGGGSGGRAVEPLTLTLLNPVREFIRMKSAMVGVCVLEFEELDASTVSVDTMPSSQLKSVKQLNAGEQRVSKRREKESERVSQKAAGEESR